MRCYGNLLLSMQNVHQNDKTRTIFVEKNQTHVSLNITFAEFVRVVAFFHDTAYNL